MLGRLGPFRRRIGAAWWKWGWVEERVTGRDGFVKEWQEFLNVLLGETADGEERDGYWVVRRALVVEDRRRGILRYKTFLR